MGSLSIRGIDSTLAVLLKKKATSSNQSVNRFVLELLREHVGLTKQKRYTQQHNDLDHLFGNWTEEEYRQIQSKIESNRQIDKEIWE